MENQLIVLPKTNSFIRFLLVFSLIFTCITLITSWLLWFNLTRDVIEKLLFLFSSKFFILDFWNFSTVIFTFVGLSFIFALPLAFIKQKNTTNNIFSLLSLFLGLALFGAALFINLLLVNNPLIGDFFSFAREHLIIVIPFYVTMLLTIFVIINSFINLVLANNKIKESKVKKIKEPKNKAVKINVDDFKITKKVANNLDTKTLATIKVIIPMTTSNKDITDNIKVYQSKDDINLDLNINDQLLS
ncbi:MAG: hypothetical protein REH79_00515 [Spiroplasma sp.]|nr:hypothetical protein [Spiroplasma sp.]